MPDLTAIASRWDCNERTAARWKRAGAPLDDDRGLRVWLSTRKNLPAGTRRKLLADGTKRRADALTAPPDPDPRNNPGAAAALARLEREEVLAHQQMEAAQKSGDMMELRAAREHWLKISESLRRYDILVERGRRDAGELVPRREIEQHVAEFVGLFKLVCVCISNAQAVNLAASNSPAEVCSILKDALHDGLISTLAAMGAIPTPRKVPPWFLGAAIHPMDDILQGACEQMNLRTCELQRVLQWMVNNIESQRKIESQQKV